MKKNTKLLIMILALAVSTGCAFAACKTGGDTSSGSNSGIEQEQGISLNKTSLALAVGGSETLTASLENIEGDIVWESSNQSVATVQNGTVTAVGVGTCNVTATCGSYVATCSVSVREALKITLDQTELALFEGDSATLTATASDGNTYDYTWSSSEENVASVSGGVVTAIKEGTAEIKAETADGAYAICTVTVYKEDVVMILSKSTASVNVGGNETLTASLSDGSSPAIAWSSSDEGVATVKDGVITAVSSGSCTITASATVEGEEVTAKCEVTVNDVYELIFPEITANAFVGETFDLNLIVKKNGVEQDLTGVTVTGNGFTAEGGVITLTRSGEISVTVSYQGESRERTVKSYIKVSDKEDLEAIDDNLTAWYMLTNDINVDGAIETIAHYSSGHTSNVNGFLGVLDGNGYSIKNYYAVYNGEISANSTLFGWIGSTGVIRNVNFLGAKVVNRISAGVAGTNYGTIENCFVEVAVEYESVNAEQNNPIGGVVSKHYGTLKNVVCITSLADSVVTRNYIGGFVGRSFAGSVIENCYSVSPVGIDFFETATPTNNGNANNLGTLTDNANYATVAELLAGMKTEGFSEIWDLQEKSIPHVGEITDTVTISNESKDVYAGGSYQINVNSVLPVAYETGAEGVSVDANGLVSVESTVKAGTKVTVKAYCVYDYEASAEIELTVQDKVEVTGAVSSISKDIVLGVTSKEDASVDLGIVVKVNDQPVTEGYTIESSDTQVATVENGVVTLVGDGTASVNVVMNGNVLYTVAVTCAAYSPIYSTDDFNGIEKNLSGKYILMNDIDFEGEVFHAFGSHNTRTTNAFKGVFDGNGYSILNVTPGQDRNSSTSNDWSIFGYVDAAGVIKNLSVIGVNIVNRTGTIASMLLGRVENCYVEATITAVTNANANNPVGVVVEKTLAGGVVENCIAVVTVADGVSTTYWGGIVGQNKGTLTNSQVINLSSEQLGVTDGSNVEADSASGTYAGLEAFYTGVDKTKYGDVWVLESGYYPHLKNASEADMAISCDDVVYQGSYINVTPVAKYGATLSLKSATDGVSLENGVLTVADGVAENTAITLVLTSKYLNKSVEKTVTVAKNSFLLNTEKTSYEFTWIKGVSTGSATLEYGITLNGNPYEGEVEFVSTNESVVTVADGVVTGVGDGTTTVAIKVNGIELGNVSVTSNMYNPVYTQSDFEGINNNLAGKFILMNDIDVKGGYIEAISTYNTGASSFFTGIFDGNGYSIMNFTPVYKGTYNAKTGNCSLFGQIGVGGVVKNLKIINVVIASRIAGGLATLNKGTIENCYVEAVMNYSEGNVNNPMGGIVSKNYGTLKNIVAVVTLGTSDTLTTANLVGTGGFIGRAYAGSVIENCYSISPDAIGFFEAGTPTNDGNANNLGTQTNYGDYDSLEGFYAAVSADAFAGWTFAAGKLPYFGTMNETLELSAGSTIYQGATETLSLTATYGATLSLKEAIDGVSIENGVLSVAATVAKDTVITVVATSKYTAVSKEISLTVVEAVFEITMEKTSYDFGTWIKGVTAADKQSETLSYSVKLNGNPYEGEVEFVSANENIAKVENGVLTATGDGTTTIAVKANGVEVASLTVASVMYNPVYTTSDFLAIGTDNTTMSYKYILMNELDFEGATVKAFSSYKTKDSIKFTGIFDGNGYALKNLVVSYNTTNTSDRDRSIFGYMDGGAIVRNVSFLNVQSADRAAIVASWVQNGIIENVYAEFVYTATGGNINANNAVGGIAGKVQAAGVVQNCVLKLTIASGVTPSQYHGLIASVCHASATITNCQAIYAGTDITKIAYSGATVTGCEVYADTASMTAEAEGYDTAVWAIDKENGTVALKTGCSSIL